jgi:hypothetical protein
MNPASFSVIGTKQNHYELELLLGTLSLHHPNAKVYCYVDTFTKQKIENYSFIENLNVNLFNELDEFSNMSRNDMERMGCFNQFLSNKFRVIEKALNKEENTLFLDSDIILLNRIELPPGNYNLGLTPQNIPIKNQLETGYFNAGFVYISEISLVRKWEKETTSSRYYEQASLENLVKSEGTRLIELTEVYNLMPWPMLLNNESSQEFATRFEIRSNKIYYNHKKLNCVHTHLRDERFRIFNETITTLLAESGNSKELTLMHKSLTGKFTITIPSQPKNTIFNHNNDSFRELAKIAANLPNSDLKINISKATNHCWLEPSILLYDRPTLEWADDELANSNCILLGNGDIEVEGKELNKISRTIPWTFWPRKPIELEFYLNQNITKDYVERKYYCTFIGNIENNVQAKFRSRTFLSKLCDLFELTESNIHKYTPSEYFDKLSNSRFGLCVRGYGKKCHREIECMALGTVPIIYGEIPMHSFYEPLEENIHYLKYDTIKDVLSLRNIPSSKWQEMSSNCKSWYFRNAHSSSLLETTIKSVLL